MQETPGLGLWLWLWKCYQTHYCSVTYYKLLLSLVCYCDFLLLPLMTLMGTGTVLSLPSGCSFGLRPSTAKLQEGQH